LPLLSSTCDNFQRFFSPISLFSAPSPSLQSPTTCVTFQFPGTELRLPHSSVVCPSNCLYVISDRISHASKSVF
jgi:hypothetical protein